MRMHECVLYAFLKTFYRTPAPDEHGERTSTGAEVREEKRHERPKTSGKNMGSLWWKMSKTVFSIFSPISNSFLARPKKKIVKASK